MALLNYTTQVDEHKTVSEIQAILSRKGASEVLIQYENGQPKGVMFKIALGAVQVPFVMPCKFDGAKAALLKRYEPRNRWKKEQEKGFNEQVRRVAWRILKDWIEAQMALVELGQVQMCEVFLPYVMLGGGRTMFQAFTENTARMLGNGEQETA